MAGGSYRTRSVRSITLIPAVVLIVGACSSTTTRTTASKRETASAAKAVQTPPAGTLPLVAPPRSSRPTFSGEAAAVETAFRARLDTLERNDVDAAIALSSRPEPSLHDDLVTFANTYRVRLYRINAIAVNGTTAAIDYEDAIVGRDLPSTVTTLLGQHDVWSKDDGSWKFVSDDSSAPGIPEDLRSVTVTLPDGAPIEVPTPLPRADFAFLLKNTGSITKGALILGIPPDADVAALIPAVAKVGVDRDNHIAAPMPDGTLEMGVTPDIPAHHDGTMVFNGRLPKGRYVLISRTASNGDRAATLLPHEYATFTVR